MVSVARSLLSVIWSCWAATSSEASPAAAFCSFCSPAYRARRSRAPCFSALSRQGSSCSWATADKDSSCASCASRASSSPRAWAALTWMSLLRALLKRSSACFFAASACSLRRRYCRAVRTRTSSARLLAVSLDLLDRNSCSVARAASSAAVCVRSRFLVSRLKASPEPRRTASSWDARAVAKEPATSSKWVRLSRSLVSSVRHCWKCGLRLSLSQVLTTASRTAAERSGSRVRSKNLRMNSGSEVKVKNPVSMPPSCAEKFTCSCSISTSMSRSSRRCFCQSLWVRVWKKSGDVLFDSCIHRLNSFMLVTGAKQSLGAGTVSKVRPWLASKEKNTRSTSSRSALVLTATA